MLNPILSALLLANTIPVIRNAAGLIEYENDNRTDEVTFDIEGTVVAPSTRDRYCFSVADTSGVTRIFFSATCNTIPLNAGDHVHIRGITSPADKDQFLCPSATKIDILGRDTPPATERIGIREFQSGNFDYRIVSVEGTVREVFHDEICREILFIVLQSGNGFIYAALGTTAHPSAIRPGEVLGRNLRLTGFVDRHPVSRRPYLGRILSVDESSGIEFLPSPVDDPFDLPDVARLRIENTADISGMDRHRAEGTVLAIWKGRRQFMLRTARGEIIYATLPESPSNPLPEPGTTAETAGYPTSDAYTITLTQARWRSSNTSPDTETESIPLSESDLSDDSYGIFQHSAAYNGHLVSISGSVLRIISDSYGENILLIESGRRLVKINEGALKDPFREIVPGSRIAVTGIYRLEADGSTPSTVFPHATGFSVVPRSAADLDILECPSWWTPSRLLVMIGGLLSALIGILAWNRSLSRIAERRGREMSRRQLQAQRAELKRQERTRLAVDLHDAISQNLTGISMQLKAVEQFADRLPADAARHVDFAAKTLGSCRAELRNILWDLRHNAIEASTMDEAIRQTLEPHLGSTALKVDFPVPRNELDENTVYSILHILRELTVNAIRHGNASVVDIRAERGKPVKITVTDNGSGFDPENHPGFEEGHFGLIGVGERIEALNGSLTIDSNTSTTVITITLPL